MLIERIEQDLKVALKTKDETKLSTLRMFKSAILYMLIEKQKGNAAPADSDVLEVLSKQIKLRRDAIEGYKKGNRSDLVAKEEKELEILQGYLPPQLTDEALQEIIQKIITQVQASSKKDAGKVMKAVMDEVRGRADGKRVNELVLKLLP